MCNQQYAHAALHSEVAVHGKSLMKCLMCAGKVHTCVCRYGYYLLSAAGVKIPKSVKKSITSMQLIQFGLFFLHALYGALYATHYRPRIIVVLCLWQAVVFASLFGQFFW